jgi:hypothetical protein
MLAANGFATCAKIVPMITEAYWSRDAGAALPSTAAHRRDTSCFDRRPLPTKAALCKPS